VASRLARALLPPSDGEPPPPWLRPDQSLSFGRAVAAARRYGGALLADRPGTGKSWIGLAVVRALEPDRLIHVVAPATLRSQWEQVASRAGVEIRFHSHEMLSRGKAPDRTAGPLLLDESHRFRNPLTRRYLTLAPWCLGRSGVLLSATPAVNRIVDVVHQLLLLVRDDALGWAGIPSLREVLAGTWKDELARLVITGEDRSPALPARLARDIRIDDTEGRLAQLQGGIATLRLSRDPALAGLIRVSLLGALGSSPDAIREALGRYHALLLHARDAEASGRILTRHTIRQFVGGELDQLVFWPLVAEPVRPPELALEDLAQLTRLEVMAREWGEAPDAKARALMRVAADGKPTLVFTNARATVRYLRRQLGTGVAWCTGEKAGVDGLPLGREAVLDLFRKAPPVERRAQHPSLLIATDVASEGVDLPLIARVVHYDLPWTAVRLDQRSGRAFRIGSRHSRVEVVRFLPPPALEAALGREAILLRKDELPEQLGLDDGDDARWRIRARIAREWSGDPVASGTARIFAARSAVVAGLRFEFSDGRFEEVVFARDGAEWTGDAMRIATLLALARVQSSGPSPDRQRLRATVRSLATITRIRLRTARGGRFGTKPGDPLVRRVRRRLRVMAQEARRERDLASLGAIERGLRFLARGHTAGEALTARGWSALDPGTLVGRLSRLPEPPVEPDMVSVAVTGLLVIDPEDALG
jgi:hypothetical protein